MDAKIDMVTEEISHQTAHRRCLSVVMPVYNEQSTISDIIEKVLAQECVAELIVVDDASTDSTIAALRFWESDSRVKTVRHTSNRGKGAAVRTGFKHVLAPIVVVQDADLEYNPADYGKMLVMITSGFADVVYGSRFMGRTNENPLWHTIGNRALTWLCNFATGLELTDEATCYKMFRSKLLSRIALREDGFGFCPEITAKLSKLGVKICEVPVTYRGRTRKQGKKIRLWDGFNAVMCIIRYNYWQ